MAARAQKLERPRDRMRIDRGADGDDRRIRWAPDRLLRGNVARHLEEDRPTTRLERDADRAIGQRRGVRGGDARLPLRDRSEERAQVELLMGRNLVAVDRPLPGEAGDPPPVEIPVRYAADDV